MANPYRFETGDDLQLKLNPTSGLWDFWWDDYGNPAFSDNESHTVLSLLLEYRGLWWADVTGQRGSNIYTIKNDKKSTSSDIKGAADEALALAVQTGTIQSFTTTVTREAPGRFTLAVSWTLPGGSPQDLLLAFGY